MRYALSWQPPDAAAPDSLTPSIFDRSVIDAIQKVLEEQPTSMQVATDIATTMAVEVLLRDSKDADSCVANISALSTVQKFSYDTLKLPRKRWPQALQDRADQALKVGRLKKVVESQFAFSTGT